MEAEAIVDLCRMLSNAALDCYFRAQVAIVHTSAAIKEEQIEYHFLLFCCSTGESGRS